MSSLYIFVGADRPDQYLNVIAHCLRANYIDNVVFLDIKTRQMPLENTATASTVSKYVADMIQELADRGVYQYFVGQLRDTRVLLSSLYSFDRSHEIQDFYRHLQTTSVPWLTKAIRYADLRKEIRRLRKADPRSVFDVTCIKKRYLGDIFAISVLEGLNSVYTFDLKVPPSFDKPWKMLIHDLAPEQLPEARLYEYVNIVNTPIFIQSWASMGLDVSTDIR